MADQFLTLAELTAMQHADTAVGVVDIIRATAPEFEVISGRPIDGINCYVTRAKQLPGGNTTIGGTMFRRVGEGVFTEASQLEQILVEAYYLDGQLQVDEALLKAQPKNAPEDILAMEAARQIRAKIIGLGQQFYQGLTRDKNGFYGLIALCDSSMQAVKGTSTTASATESVYLVRNTLDGVHFVFGNGTGLQAGQWMRQKVYDKNNKSFFAYVNNYSGYIGLANNHPLSICRIPDLDDSGTAGTYITDQLLADASALFPVGFGPTHVFMSRRQRKWLRKSRSVVTQANLTASTPLIYAPVPTETSEGTPIYVTDSITLTEAVV